jgi:hypothetical protein
MEDLGYCVNAINMKARKLNAVSAQCNDLQQIYQLATEIALEAQKVREMSQKEMNKWNGNQRLIGETIIGNTPVLRLLTFLRLLPGLKKK